MTVSTAIVSVILGAVNTGAGGRTASTAVCVVTPLVWLDVSCATNRTNKTAKIVTINNETKNVVVSAFVAFTVAPQVRSYLKLVQQLVLRVLQVKQCLFLYRVVAT